jgi:ABC-type antimicrobial peptide transport system permease subunit
MKQRIWKLSPQQLKEKTGLEQIVGSRVGQFRRFWSTLSRNYITVWGLGIIVIMIILAVLAPYIAPYGYETMILPDRICPIACNRLTPSIYWAPITLAGIS